MIRPNSFGFNSDTESSNKFQKRPVNKESKQIQAEALKEFDRMVDTIRDQSIQIQVFNDLENAVLPDAIFPNNWISTHEDGSIYTYPMQSPLRRAERRDDIIENLEKNYIVSKRYSLELFEVQNQFLEGTGSMVLDRDFKIAYACLSPRTDARVLHKFSLLSGYKINFFKARDKNGFEIYHTNVLMSLGKDFVVCCMEAIEESQRDSLREMFLSTGKELLEIDLLQLSEYAANIIQLKNKAGKHFIVLSETALNSMTPEMVMFLNSRGELIPVTIPTIESIGGGSARCMIVENFLPVRM